MSTLCIVWDELNIPVKLKVYSSWTYELSSYKSYIFVLWFYKGSKGIPRELPRGANLSSEALYSERAVLLKTTGFRV